MSEGNGPPLGGAGRNNDALASLFNPISGAPSQLAPLPSDRFFDPKLERQNPSGFLPEFSGTKDAKPSNFSLDTKPEEDCANCCPKWLVITVERKLKYIHQKGGYADKRYVTLGGTGDWYATAGDVKVEIWKTKNGPAETLLMTCASVERGGVPGGRGGVGTKESGKQKMIPAGTYRLAPLEGHHHTYNYERSPGDGGLPGINIRGKAVSNTRGINIHSGGNWAYSVGCIVLATKKNLDARETVMTNMKPNWFSECLIRN